MRPVIWATLAVLSCNGRPLGVEEFVDGYCGVALPCCRQGSPDLCRARISAAAPAATYDPVAGRTCLDGLRTAAARKRCPAVDEVTDEACARAFGGGRGPSPLGSRCERAEDCAPTPQGVAYCAPAEGGQRCKVLLHGGPGEGCRGNSTASFAYLLRKGILIPAEIGTYPPPPPAYCPLEDGLFCGPDHTCTAVRPDGASCGKDQLCGVASFCPADPGVCQARAPGGGVCDPDLPGPRCVTGFFCPPDSRRCTPGLAPDAPCTDDDQCRSGFCSEGACVNEQPVILHLFEVCASADALTTP